MSEDTPGVSLSLTLGVIVDGEHWRGSYTITFVTENVFACTSKEQGTG